MSDTTSRSGRLVVWSIAAALFVLHQDYWWWDNKALVLGFMPIGLFYHAMFSIAAGLTWALATKIAWPSEIEAWATGSDSVSRDEGKVPQ